MANDYHEPYNQMSPKDRDIVKALNSLKEEIEAVDWYHQRCAVCTDEELKEIMWHNALEEMEHAMMTLEWLRRNQEGWHDEMKTYLFTEGPIMELEEAEEEDSAASKDLGIGDL